MLLHVRRLLPAPLLRALVWPRREDQYIASFPRSGNTWLRTVITNVLDPDSGSDPDAFNARIPGLSFRNLAAIQRLPSPRLLKTHSAWWPGVRRAVYLVRNGEDVLVSYYHYLTTRGGQKMSFESFYHTQARGELGPPWHVHVESWLERGRRRLGDRLLVVRFEDLKAAPEPTVAEILAFLRIEATPVQITQALAAASVENMRAIETRRWGFETAPDASFYRGGKVNQGEGLFTPALRSHFERTAGRALQLGGYDAVLADR